MHRDLNSHSGNLERPQLSAKVEDCRVTPVVNGGGFTFIQGLIEFAEA